MAEIKKNSKKAPRSAGAELKKNLGEKTKEEAIQKLNQAREAWEIWKAKETEPKKMPDATGPSLHPQHMPWAIPIPVMMNHPHPHPEHERHRPDPQYSEKSNTSDIPLPPKSPQIGTLTEAIQQLIQMGTSIASTVISSGVQIMQCIHRMPYQGEPHHPYQHGHHDICCCESGHHFLQDYRCDCNCNCDYDPCCNPSVHGCHR